MTLIDEPNVDELVRANIWHLTGTDRDLVVDTGLGIASLRNELPNLFENNPEVVLTHGHLDHIGGAHEFDRVSAHTADQILIPDEGTLDGTALAHSLGLASYDEPIPDVLITARPTPGYEPSSYRLLPPKNVHWLSEGDIIDLGDRRFTVLHLPGHSRGSIALYDPADGTIFTGDVVYEGPLLDTIKGSDVRAYATSMERLRSLHISVVYPGHGDPFGPERLHAIIEDYLTKRRAIA
ncbi:MBL fold metallo-hydrolase [Subtercola lobariae]|uniref:MBL fold metallo-hydrolase n=1 Tax=Subtercola lobariae TaxID=1588641 RepID=UPI00166D3747|nr:MBL fold metallo-hydrolase [Subtercola lobariae]